MKSRSNIFSIDLSEVELPKVINKGTLSFSDDYIAISERKLLGPEDLDDLILTIRDLHEEIDGLDSISKMERVIDIYEMWYEHIRAYERETGVPDFYCHKGCSSCCHQPVKASRFEANLILDYVEREGIEFDRTLLKKHLGVLKSYDRIGKWKESLGESESRCIFLDAESGSCKVHKVRPLNCRNFFAVGSSKYCGKSTEGLGKDELDRIQQVRFSKLAEISTAFLNLIGGQKENRWLADSINFQLDAKSA